VADKTHSHQSAFIDSKISTHICCGCKRRDEKETVMKFRSIDGEGYVKNDNRESGGALVEDGILGCIHCHAAIHRQDVEKPKTGITIRAKCWACDGYLCPECGFATYLYGHSNTEHVRTWPHHMWINYKINEIHRRQTLGA